MANWEELKKRVDATDADDLGDVIWQAINEYDNSSTDMGKYTSLVFDDCKTDREFYIANAMLIAIAGWGIECLLDRLPEDDEDDEEVLAN